MRERSVPAPSPCLWTQAVVSLCHHTILCACTTPRDSLSYSRVVTGEDPQGRDGASHWQIPSSPARKKRGEEVPSLPPTLPSDPCQWPQQSPRPNTRGRAGLTLSLEVGFAGPRTGRRRTGWWGQRKTLITCSFGSRIRVRDAGKQSCSPGSCQAAFQIINVLSEQALKCLLKEKGSIMGGRNQNESQLLLGLFLSLCGLNWGKKSCDLPF